LLFDQKNPDILIKDKELIFEFLNRENENTCLETICYFSNTYFSGTGGLSGNSFCHRTVKT